MSRVRLPLDHEELSPSRQGGSATRSAHQRNASTFDADSIGPNGTTPGEKGDDTENRWALQPPVRPVVPPRQLLEELLVRAAVALDDTRATLVRRNARYAGFSTPQTRLNSAAFSGSPSRSICRIRSTRPSSPNVICC